MTNEEKTLLIEAVTSKVESRLTARRTFQESKELYEMVQYCLDCQGQRNTHTLRTDPLWVLSRVADYLVPEKKI